MSSRGFIAFVADGVEKISYNHNDSYPEGLGLDVLHWLRQIVAAGDRGLTALAEAATALRVVDPASTPTAEDIDRYGRYADTLGSHSLDEWYALLRRTQGDPALILEAGVIEDAASFPTDSLFAEWGYVVDVDAGVLEVYRGFQHLPHVLGRFADRPGSQGGYHPCALFASWSLDLLPTDDEFLVKLGQSVPA